MSDFHHHVLTYRGTQRLSTLWFILACGISAGLVGWYFVQLPAEAAPEKARLPVSEIHFGD